MSTMVEDDLYWSRVEQCNEIGQREGWALFWTEDGLQLQRDDEADRFCCDEGAARYVQDQAAHGSEIHKLALQLTS